MKKRPLQKVEAGCGAASAAVYAVGGTAEGHRQIGWKMAFLP